MTAGQGIELVAFDLGNVMVRVEEGPPTRRLARLAGRPCREVFEAVFAPSRKALFESGKITWQQHAENVIASLGLDMSEPELRAIYKTVLSPIPEAVQLVDRVLARCRITIASNTAEPHWEWTRENLPFADRFDPPVLSYQVGAMKPDAAFYRNLVERSGLEPGDILFTDDRSENVDAALVAGIQAFQCLSPANLERELGLRGLV
jgi:HAD superfamily hydrolase (TIGR01509 family)